MCNAKKHQEKQLMGDGGEDEGGVPDFFVGQQHQQYLHMFMCAEKPYSGEQQLKKA